MGEDHHDIGPKDSDNHGVEHSRGDTGEGSHALPGGLTVATDGLRLETAETRLNPGVEQGWSFQIKGENGEIVTKFEETHDQLAHLVLVRRDLTRFQHLHPEMTQDGAWSVEYTLPDPGVYRAFVDVLVEGQPTTLGVDLLASGSADYEQRPQTSREVTVSGYEIQMSPASIPPSENTVLDFEIRRDNQVVQLKPYLGALGHLVAIRDGDLAYLHVHPEERHPAGGIVRFRTRFPTVGRYRLFLQAKPNGELITTSFDLQVTES
ncbi:hypothetical protein [Saliphagus infecundisoli]|uniref:Secreted protein n=1 Tax=Saliphagus infecundisoli TaxID=1849069 RepID=A0ABD5QIA4_9EURY|nr:hypothetical protein [Saliphagus infecundisoli]